METRLDYTRHFSERRTITLEFDEKRRRGRLLIMSDQIYDWKETVLHLEIVLLNEILEFLDKAT